MPELKQANEEYARSKRKPRLFGPGTVFMIIGLLVIGGWRLLHPPKVMIERQVEAGGEINFKRQPSVSDLVSWSQDLNLKAAQEESLKKLLEEEQVKLKPVEEEIGKVMQEFDRFASKREGKPAGLKEFQATAQPISELSREKREIGQSFAARGLGILDEKQKDMARRLWEAKLARIKSGKKEVANP